MGEDSDNESESEKEEKLKEHQEQPQEEVQQPQQLSGEHGVTKHLKTEVETRPKSSSSEGSLPGTAVR